jgi:hypothetical protein
MAEGRAACGSNIQTQHIKAHHRAAQESIEVLILAVWIIPLMAGPQGACSRLQGYNCKPQHRTVPSNCSE